MEAKAETLSSIRSYLLDYVVGILWLLSAALIAGSADWLTAMVDILQMVRDLPEFVLGFAVVIAGVVVPYCVSILVRPITIQIMNRFLHIHRSFRKWRRTRRAAKEKPHATGETAGSLANKRLTKLFGHFDLNSRQVRLTYLYARNRSLAAQLEKTQDDIWFQAAAALPSAILVASITYRVAAWHPAYISAGLGLITFSFASWSINRQFMEWWSCLDAAVLVVPENP
jgi:ABC-type multidrug transport system fused ATPase/permease subunit